MIRFNCHRCGMLMQAADSGARRHAKCPGCGLILTIPQTAADVPDALQRAKSLSKQDAVIVITGSIYVVGEAMRLLGTRV